MNRVSLNWEEMDTDASLNTTFDRAKVPNGWVIKVGNGAGGLVFVPDENHEWK